MKAPSVGRLVNFESEEFSFNAGLAHVFCGGQERVGAAAESTRFKVSDIRLAKTRGFMVAAFLGDDTAASTAHAIIFPTRHSSSAAPQARTIDKGDY